MSTVLPAPEMPCHDDEYEQFLITLKRRRQHEHTEDTYQMVEHHQELATLFAMDTRRPEASY